MRVRDATACRLAVKRQDVLIRREEARDEAEREARIPAQQAEQQAPRFSGRLRFARGSLTKELCDNSPMMRPLNPLREDPSMTRTELCLEMRHCQQHRQRRASRGRTTPALNEKVCTDSPWVDAQAPAPVHVEFPLCEVLGEGNAIAQRTCVLGADRGCCWVAAEHKVVAIRAAGLH